MADEPCGRAQRVTGVPQEVVAWIDHDRQPNLLLLNADCFTAQEEAAMTAALTGRQYSAQQVMSVLVKVKGQG
jgi:hypothetical protein